MPALTKPLSRRVVSNNKEMLRCLSEGGEAEQAQEDEERVSISAANGYTLRLIQSLPSLQPCWF